MRNNKGQMSMFIFILIIGVLVASIMLFVGGIITIKINDALSQDVEIGQVNLQDINDDTFGVFNAMYLNNADWWGLSVIFGMMFGLFLSAYFLRGKYPKFGIIFDIFIILAAFIFSLYISSTYSILVDSLNNAGEPFLETYIPKTSMFLLNLHIFVVIIGVISMVLFHSSIPRRTEEAYQTGGVLQGAY